MDRRHVTRIATITDSDTLEVAHHLFGAPGFQSGAPGTWPQTRIYTEGQVNNARLWRKTTKRDGALPDKRIIWRPTPQR